MLLKMFDTTEVIVFAKEVVIDIDKLFPARPKPPTPKTLEKDRKKLDTLIFRVRVFAKNHKLNIYKKAKFLNTIKWKLKDAHHEEAFINDMVALLATVLN